MLHYLTPEEEKAVKASIPWDSVDRKARDLVWFANQAPGVATLQSCAGHVHPNEWGGFNVNHAQIAFRADEEQTRKALFHAAPQAGIDDIGLRYFDDGTFWICVSADPSERGKLYDFFKLLGASNEEV